MKIIKKADVLSVCFLISLMSHSHARVVFLLLGLDVGVFDGLAPFSQIRLDAIG